jgi:hypothetical protein
MEQHDRDSDHAHLCGLYVAISRLQRFTEQRERRGIDCTAARELIATLREQATSMSGQLKRQGLNIVGMLSQIPALSTSILITGA